MSFIGSPPIVPSPIVYPSTLVPNFVRNLTLPDYGIRIFENEDGTEIRQKVFETGHGTKLQFDYEGVSEEYVNLIIRFYAHCRGSYYPFMIPLEIVSHPAPYLNAIFSLGGTGLWRFSDTDAIAPRTELVGIYSFSVIVQSLEETFTIPDVTSLIAFIP